MPESRYDRTVSQGLRSGIDQYLTESDRALDEKWGRGAARPPRVRITESDKANLELKTIAALTSLENAVAKRLKGESLTMRERNSVQSEIYGLIVGMHNAETQGFSGQGSARIKAAGTREGALRDRAATELEAVLQQDPLDAKLQGELSGISIHMNNGNWSGVVTGLLLNQDSIRTNWGGMLAQLSLNTGYSPGAIAAAVEKAAMTANEESFLNAVRDNQARITDSFQDAERLLKEADVAQEEGSRVIGMSGRARSDMQRLWALADGDPEEIAAALGLEVTGTMPEDEIVKQARGIADRLIKRIENMTNDLTGEEIYDMLLRGGELEEFIRAKGHDPAQMSTSQKRAILDATIHKGAKDARQKGMYTRTLNVFDSFSDMVPGGEEPDPADMLEALLYSTFHPFKIIRELHRRAPVRGAVKDLIARVRGEDDPEAPQDSPQEGPAFLPEEHIRLQDESIQDTRQDVAEALPEEPEDPGPEVPLWEGDKRAELMGAGATGVFASPGDDYGPYAQFSDGTVGFIHPETGELVRVSEGQTGFAEITEVMGGSEESLGDPGTATQPGQPGVPGGEAEFNPVSDVLGGILSPEEIPEELPAGSGEESFSVGVDGDITYPSEAGVPEEAPPAPPTEDARLRAEARARARARAEARAQARAGEERQALVDQMPDESGDVPSQETRDFGEEVRSRPLPDEAHWARLREEAQEKVDAAEARTMPEGTKAQLQGLRSAPVNTNEAEGPLPEEEEAEIDIDIDALPEGTDEQRHGNLDAQDPQGAQGDEEIQQEKEKPPEEEPPESVPDYGGQPPRGNAPQEFMPGGNQYQAPDDPVRQGATKFEENKMGVVATPPPHRPGAGIMAPPNISGADAPANTEIGDSKKKRATQIGMMLKQQAQQKMQEQAAPQ